MMFYAKRKKQLESLLHIILIFSNDIGKEFAVVKCAILKENRVCFERVQRIEITKWSNNESRNCRLNPK